MATVFTLEVMLRQLLKNTRKCVVLSIVFWYEDISSFIIKYIWYNECGAQIKNMWQHNIYERNGDGKQWNSPNDNYAVFPCLLFMLLRLIGSIRLSYLELYGIMHIKERIFSGCEYENDAAKFSVVFLHDVFHHCDQWSLRIAGCIVKCCKVTKTLATLFYLCLTRPVGDICKSGHPDIDLHNCSGWPEILLNVM